MASGILSVYLVAKDGLLRIQEVIRADIMIDDHLKNPDYFIGVTDLFSAPHNHFESSSKPYTRPLMEAGR